MAQIRFTSWLREIVPDAAIDADGATVGDALAAVFTALPHVRGYVLDDRGTLRKHVCVFADGRRLPRETTLSHPIKTDSQLYVMQALSGG
jgi:molybdopterin synthase sulfur carrier subunit